jgi:segregation and condensation protein A
MTGVFDTSPPGTAVVFGAGRRPEVALQVRAGEFEGPLALLLSLIEARQLDVLTVPLGALTEAYLDALAGLDDDRIGNISAFVAVAGQLILIKSRAMLPRRLEPIPNGILPDEEPDPEAELRARLLLYRAYRDAGAALAARALETHGLYRREPAAARVTALAGAIAAPGPPVDPTRLVRALDRLVRLVPPPAPPPEVVPRAVTLTDRARVIRAALLDAPVVVLQEILAGVHDRVIVAVTFLAMLELMKRREIVVEQTEPWGPIVARATTAAERAAARGALDAERGGDDPDAPLDESLGSFA